MHTDLSEIVKGVQSLAGVGISTFVHFTAPALLFLGCPLWWYDILPMCSLAEELAQLK